MNRFTGVSSSGIGSSLYSIVLLVSVGFLSNWLAAYRIISSKRGEPTEGTTGNKVQKVLSPNKRETPPATEKKESLAQVEVREKEKINKENNSNISVKKNENKTSDKSDKSVVIYKRDSSPLSSTGAKEVKLLDCPIPLIIGFKVNSGEIDKIKQKLLRKKISLYKKFLAEHKGSYIVIRGYSSPGGDKIYNLRLSYIRAESALQLFYRLGVPLQKLKIKAEGSGYSREKVKALNLPRRRVEISIDGVDCRYNSPLILK